MKLINFDGIFKEIHEQMGSKPSDSYKAPSDVTDSGESSLPIEESECISKDIN